MINDLWLMSIWWDAQIWYRRGPVCLFANKQSITASQITDCKRSLIKDLMKHFKRMFWDSNKHARHAKCEVQSAFLKKFEIYNAT